MDIDNLNTPYPQYGTLISLAFAHMASNRAGMLPEFSRSAWKWSWQSPSQYGVTGKHYFFNGTNVTEIKLELAAQSNLQSEKTEITETIDNTSSATLLEMLLSITDGDLITSQGKTYTTMFKHFHKTGDSWRCDLYAREPNLGNINLISSTLSHNDFIHAARLGDKAFVDAQWESLGYKAFTEVSSGQYKTAIHGTGNTYTTTTPIDINGVILTSTSTDLIVTSSGTRSIKRKVFEPKRADPDIVNAFLEVQ